MGAKEANSARIGRVGKVRRAQAFRIFPIFLGEAVQGLKEKTGFFFGNLQGKRFGLAKFDTAAGKFQKKRARLQANESGFNKRGRRFGFAVFSGAPKSLFEAKALITAGIGDASRLVAV